MKKHFYFVQFKQIFGTYHQPTRFEDFTVLGSDNLITNRDQLLELLEPLRLELEKRKQYPSDLAVIHPLNISYIGFLEEAEARIKELEKLVDKDTLELYSKNKRIKELEDALNAIFEETNEDCVNKYKIRNRIKKALVKESE